MAIGGEHNCLCRGECQPQTVWTTWPSLTPSTTTTGIYTACAHYRHGPSCPECHERDRRRGRHEKPAA